MAQRATRGPTVRDALQGPVPAGRRVTALKPVRRPDMTAMTDEIAALRRISSEIPSDAERLDAARNLVNNWRHYDTNGCLADLHDILNGKDIPSS